MPCCKLRRVRAQSRRPVRRVAAPGVADGHDRRHFTMMCVTKGFGLAALFLGLMAGAAGQAVGVTIVNGDFEETTVDPGGFYVVLPGGSTAITGWTVTGAAIEQIGTFWQASSGLRSIDLSGSDRRRHRADLRHRRWASRTGSRSTSRAIRTRRRRSRRSTSAPPGRSQDFTFDTTGKTRANMGYIPMTFDFTAASASTTLAFTSLDRLLRGAGPGQRERDRRPRAIDPRHERHRPGHAGPRLRAASSPDGRRLTTGGARPLVRGDTPSGRDRDRVLSQIRRGTGLLGG